MLERDIIVYSYWKRKMSTKTLHTLQDARKRATQAIIRAAKINHYKTKIYRFPATHSFWNNYVDVSSSFTADDNNSFFIRIIQRNIITRIVESLYKTRFFFVNQRTFQLIDNNNM